MSKKTLGFWVLTSFVLILVTPSAHSIEAVGTAQIEEAIMLTSRAKVTISEFYFDNGRLPSDNAEAGLAEPNDVDSNLVSSIELKPPGNILKVTFSQEADVTIAGRSIYVYVKIQGNTMSWYCAADPQIVAIAPSDCQRPFTPPPFWEKPNK